MSNRFINKLLSLFFPPQCVACRTQISDIHSFCINCWSQITFISKPYCFICGTPFPAKIDEKICAFCQETKPSHDMARSAVKFNDFTAKLVHEMKYYDRMDLAPVMAKLITNINFKATMHTSFLAPIPLHLKRLRLRKFNQAQLLCKFIGSYAKIKLIPDLLIRVKDIPRFCERDIKRVREVVTFLRETQKSYRYAISHKIVGMGRDTIIFKA